MSKLAELKAAYEAAGSGHWVVDNNTNALAYPGWELIDLSVIPPCVFAVAGTEARFKFIALAHNNMAALLEAVERLEAMQRTAELAAMTGLLIWGICRAPLIVASTSN